MGSSSKKRKEKRKDFVKPRLKVGKAKPKNSNVTDTSFKSKAIVLAAQSISQVAPTTAHLLNHNLSLLTHHSPITRREALSYLVTYLPPTLTDSSTQSIPVAILVSALSPLILDHSASVRAQLLTLFRSLPNKHIELYIPKILLYVNSAMTHIIPEIRMDSIKFLGWLLGVNGHAVLRNGGWTKCVWGFLGALGFDSGNLVAFRGRDKSSALILGGARAGSSDSLGSGVKNKAMVQHLSVLKEFLTVGLLGADKKPNEADAIERSKTVWSFGTSHWTTHLHLIPSDPSRSNIYSYLGLFSAAAAQQDDGAIEDMEARRRWLLEGSGKEARLMLRKGLEGICKEGGELGRMGGRVLGVLQDGLPIEIDG